ncbi:MAG TPA: PP2C family protein-serine/threonine phosphatase [Solirubrobacteraceae bacterium]|nr:PP2C family protein-serine/threonine phosphatase [Solirubrobacteraceae bacterium]
MRAARAPASSAHAKSQVRKDPLSTIGRQLPLPIPVPDWSKPIILALLLLALWLGVRSRVAALRARRLEGQRVTLLRDLGAMQTALVPDVPASLGGLAVSVAYRPADGPAAGGDFYDVFEPSPGKVAIILGDVAGHGHEALKHAALTRYTLRAYMHAGLEPKAALALAGEVLADPAREYYATVATAVYDASAGKLTYALAGHPHPILRGFQTREPVNICVSPPIGWGVPTGRRQTTLSLPVGARVCFFSDGLIEARCAGELLGRERLAEIVTALGARPTAAALLERVRALTQGVPDDMAACVFEPETAVDGACTHVEELEVDARALAEIRIQRFLEACQVPRRELAHAVELARDIIATFGTAQLRIKIEPAGASVTVSPPPRATSRRRPQATEQPLLQALSS